MFCTFYRKDLQQAQALDLPWACFKAWQLVNVHIYTQKCSEHTKSSSYSYAPVSLFLARSSVPAVLPPAVWRCPLAVSAVRCFVTHWPAPPRVLITALQNLTGRNSMTQGSSLSSALGVFSQLGTAEELIEGSAACSTSPDSVLL